MKRGFTLIELLIVIAILGILAAAILAAIDPLQQIKKGRDTATRNLMIEYSNALLRYNAVQGQFPWGASSVPLNNLNGMGTYTGLLVNAGELKTKFVDLAGAQNLLKVAINATPTSATLCFLPESKAERGGLQAKFTNTGADQAGCIVGGTNATCHICNSIE